MSTKSKNCPSSQKNQARKKPPTPPPQPVPTFTPIPCPRDQRAYRLHLDGLSQRRIAARLKCAQPTVLRGIRRMEKWLATTLPEDRGEYTASEKLRLALARHEMLLTRLQRIAFREFRRSCQTVAMEKTITKTKSLDKEGNAVEVRVEKWEKHQIGRKWWWDAVGKSSHEMTVLAAGWLGSGSGSVSMAEVMDPEERDRWDRMVTTRDARIEELQMRVAELEQTRGEQPADRGPLASPAPVSPGTAKNTDLYQEPRKKIAVTSTQQAACVPTTDTPTPREVESQNLYHDPSSASSIPRKLAPKYAVSRLRPRPPGDARSKEHARGVSPRPTPPDPSDEPAT